MKQNDETILEVFKYYLALSRVGSVELKHGPQNGTEYANALRATFRIIDQ